MNELAVVSLEDAIEQVPAGPEWIWQGMFAKGWITILTGSPKAGKTSLVVGLWDAMTRGEGSFLGLDLRPTRSLILTEQPRGVFAETLHNFNLRVGPDVDAAFYDEQPEGLSWSDAIESATAICQRDERELLIIDTFALWAGIKEEFDRAAILNAMKPLRRAGRAGVSVVIVHHNRKAGGKDGSEISGRVEFPAQADILVSLKRSGANRKLSCTSRTMQTPAEVLYGLAPEHGFQVVDGDAARLANVERVRAGLRRLGGQATRSEIERESGIPTTTITRLLRQMIASGDVRELDRRGNAHVFALVGDLTTHQLAPMGGGGG